MKYEISAGVGFVAITGLIYLFKWVRRQRVNKELETIRAKEFARSQKNKPWDGLIYDDVRIREQRVANDGPSYFEHAATGTFQALSETQKVRALNDPNATTAKFRALSETGRHRALSNQ